MLAIQPNTQWCTLSKDHTSESDHTVIQWEVDVDRQLEADHERRVGGNVAAMIEEDVKAAEKL